MGQCREFRMVDRVAAADGSLGVPIAEAIVEAVRRLSMRRVAVVTTNSLSGPGGLAEAVVKVLGSKFQSIVSGIQFSHAPRRRDPRFAKALDGIDGVVTIGGGSVCDSVKAARLCLANGISDPVGDWIGCGPMTRLGTASRTRPDRPRSPLSRCRPLCPPANSRLQPA